MVKNALHEWENTMLYKMYINKFLLPTLDIEEEEELLYYNEHPSLFHTPVYVKIEEIVVTTEKEAEILLHRLKEGTDFEFLTYLSLPDRMDATQWRLLDTLPPHIKNLITPLLEGAVAGPLTHDKGHSLYLLKARKGGALIPFDKARSRIKNYLKKEKYEQNLSGFIATLRTNAHIEYNKELINRLSP